jgi:hypothetical protein
LVGAKAPRTSPTRTNPFAAHAITAQTITAQTIAAVAPVLLVEVAALAQGFLGAALHFDVIEFGLGLDHPARGGGLDAALFARCWQTGGQLVFHGTMVRR